MDVHMDMDIKFGGEEIVEGLPESYCTSQVGTLKTVRIVEVIKVAFVAN